MKQAYAEQRAVLVTVATVKTGDVENDAKKGVASDRSFSAPSQP